MVDGMMDGMVDGIVKETCLELKPCFWFSDLFIAPNNLFVEPLKTGK